MNRLQLTSCLLASTLLLAAGCASEKTSTSTASTPKASSNPPTAVSNPSSTSPTTTTPPNVTTKVVRIKAGASAPVTDKDGNVWAADAGFDGGDVVERPDITISGTPNPMIYQSEHYSMTSFTWPVANGKYTVKLHFCETYDGITDAGMRVFSFKVQDQPEVKDFDVWKKAGGFLKPDVETFNNVNVTNGKLTVTFTPNVENPQINGIEIIPAS